MQGIHGGNKNILKMSQRINMDLLNLCSPSDWQKMEGNFEFATPPTFYIPDEMLENGKLQEYLKSIRPYLDIFPIVKLTNKNLKAMLLDDFNLLVETEVAVKKFDGLQKSPVGEITVTSKDPVMLQDYVNEQIEKSALKTVNDFLTPYGRRGHSFKYIENVEDPSRIVDVKKSGLKWDLDKENGIEEELQGISLSTLYFGSKNAIFPFHGEEGNLMSLNYHLYGEPKVWYSPVQQAIHRVEDILALFPCADSCKVYHRHKHNFLNMSMFRHLDVPIPIFKTEQKPGEIVITNSFHQGINKGFNINIAVNVVLDKNDFNRPELGSFCGPDCKYEVKSQLLGRLEMDTGLECQICRDHSPFKSSKGYKKHMLKEHKIVIPAREPVGKCPICSKKLANIEDHVKKQHKNRPLQICGLCRNGFKNSTAFLKHWTSSHKKGNRKCKTCKETVDAMSDAQFHNCIQ